MGDYKKLLKSLKDIEKYLRKERVKDFFLYVYIFSLIFYIVSFTISKFLKPTSFLPSFALFLAGILFSFFIYLYPKVNIENIASWIDRITKSKNKVINALQIGKEKGVLFRDLIIRDGISVLSSFSPKRLINSFRRKFLIRTSISLTLLSGILFFLPVSKIPFPPSYKLKIVPGNAKVEKGRSLIVKAFPEGEIPPFAKVKSKKRENFMEFSSSYFSYTFNNVQIPFSYGIITIGFNSPIYKVKLIEPLKIEKISEEIFPPSYTHLKKIKFEGMEKKEVPENSFVKFRIIFNYRIDKVSLENVKNPSISSNRRQIEGNFYIKEKSPILKVEELGNINSFYLPLEGKKDSPPIIQITKPGKDIEGEDKVLKIDSILRDDYGLKNAFLKVKKDNKEYIYQSLKLNEEKEKNITWNIKLESLKLNDGEEISYWVEAKDNHFLRGNLGKSEVYHYLWKIKNNKKNEEIIISLKEIIEEEEKIYKDTKKNIISGKNEDLSLRQENVRKKTLKLSQESDVFYPFPVRKTLKKLADKEMRESVYLLSFKKWEDALKKEEAIIKILKTLIEQTNLVVEGKIGNLDDIEKIDEKLSKIIEKGKEIIGDMERGKENKDIELKHSEWEKMIEDLRKDVDKIPQITIPHGTIINQVNEIYSDVEMAKEYLTQKVTRMAVTRDQIALELAEKLSQDLEMWLPDTPDRLRWELEQPDEIPNVPMADLPDELEDLIGELLESEENLLSDAEDFTSSWADSLSQAGWAVMDGPISNFSAKGKTGNILPNINEITGRSGEGRTGPTSGEMVQSEIRGLGGRKTPLRYTPDQAMEGVIKEKRRTPTGGGTTLGGKLAGEGGGGLPGEAPFDYVQGLKNLEKQSFEIMGMAKKVRWYLSSLGYPVGKINESISKMKEANLLFKEKDLGRFLRKHREAILDLSYSQKEVKGEIEWRKGIPSSLPDNYRIPIIKSLKEKFPAEYAKYIKEYFKKIVEE